jgi:hypothetical protein
LALRLGGKRIGHMVSTSDLLAKVLNCKCGSFESSLKRVYQCRNCGTIIPFFKEFDEINELPHWEKTSSAENPTNPNLVWGTRQQINRSFHKRVSVVQYLIKCLSGRCYIGADISGGAGRWLPYLAIYCDQFLHMDISREALEVACSTHKTNTNVIYVQNDLLADQQMVGKVNVAFCLDTLLYGGDFIDRALSSCSKILSDNGVLIVEFTSKYHIKISKVVKMNKKDAVERSVTIQEARNILRYHGFGILKEMYLFKEIPLLVNSMVNNLILPGSIINMSTWFYFIVNRSS